MAHTASTPDSTSSEGPGSRGEPVPDPRRARKRAALSGFLFGCGIAASMIDLFIFHLGLQWHHFYDLSTHEVALVTDGFFHAFGWFITVWGLFLLADVRRRGGVGARSTSGSCVRASAASPSAPALTRSSTREARKRSMPTEKAKLARASN